MIFIRRILVTIPIIMGIGCNSAPEMAAEPKLCVDYVDPLIGTAPSTTFSALKHGEGKENNAQVVPFVTAPFAMTNWTPETKSTEKKCVAPYYYKDSIITGFRGSHWLSGSCTQDYGSFTLMPVSGPTEYVNNKRWSSYSHNTEKSTPYLYEVLLKDYNIQVGMTATNRSGLFKIEYRTSEDAHLIVVPNSDEGEGFVKILPETHEIVGYNPAHRIYQGWGESAGFKGFFVIKVYAPIKEYGVFSNESLNPNEKQLKNKNGLGAYVTLQPTSKKPIYVSVGTSFTSIEQARANLDAETVNLDFDAAVDNLKIKWEALLSSVNLEGSNEEDKTQFYTALYHSYLQPRTFNDVDGSYPSFSGGQEIMTLQSGGYYGDFSMWDTYRASHPLFNLLTPSKSQDMVQSLLLKAEQGGWLPIFPCWNSYTSAMIGDHVIATIADAYTKDIFKLNQEQYAYLLKNAFEQPHDFEEYKSGKGRRALDTYLKYGFVPLEDKVEESFHQNEQVSRTLEYAFDDFALSQVAYKMGDTLNYELLKKRAFNYKNVYSQKDRAVRGRYANGTFIEEYDKFSRQSFITEGTPYQYTWYVPQDVLGLANLMGGREAFNANLDEFYKKDQYWHGNEPGHQIPFLYNFSGQPWKTQRWVDEILSTEYDSSIGGLSGNDDAGQMSAWYVWASIGFYPVAPSVPQYVISGPHFDKVTLKFENGKRMVINAPGASQGKKYIQGIKLNGKPYHKTYIDHFELVKGGVMDFEMSNEPNKSWGTKKESVPFSLSKFPAQE